MSVNPYPNLPRDKGQEAMQNYPSPKKALARYASENSSASSVISVSHDTTAIEIAAVGGAAVVRWVPVTETAGVAPAASVISAFTGSNFDHVISTGEVRRFAIPIETMFNAVGSVVGANRANGLYQRVAIKAVGISSVLLTEY
jgi:hypothetical protein